MYKNILIPTDGSELARRGCAARYHLDENIGAKITALTVLTPFPVFTADAQAVEGTEPEYTHRMEEIRAKLLNTIAAAARAAGVECETVSVAHDHPYEAIIDTAKTGRRGVSAIVLGSETVKVLTHSKFRFSCIAECVFGKPRIRRQKEFRLPMCARLQS